MRAFSSLFFTTQQQTSLSLSLSLAGESSGQRVQCCQFVNNNRERRDTRDATAPFGTKSVLYLSCVFTGFSYRIFSAKVYNFSKMTVRNAIENQLWHRCQ